MTVEIARDGEAVTITEPRQVVEVGSSAYSVGVARDGDAVTITEPRQVVEVGSRSYSVDATSVVVIADGRPYTGQYDVVPSGAEQVLATAGKLMATNVVVHPIPSNYGLVEWNGSVLKVS